LAGDTGKRRIQLQTEAPQVDHERNRSEALDRPRHTTNLPSKDDGRGGEQRYVEKDGAMWFYFKANGRWWKVRAENG
jgi:hypothetical protein